MAKLTKKWVYISYSNALRLQIYTITTRGLIATSPKRLWLEMKLFNTSGILLLRWLIDYIISCENHFYSSNKDDILTERRVCWNTYMTQCVNLKPFSLFIKKKPFSSPWLIGEKVIYLTNRNKKFIIEANLSYRFASSDADWLAHMQWIKAESQRCTIYQHEKNY